MTISSRWFALVFIAVVNLLAADAYGEKNASSTLGTVMRVMVDDAESIDVVVHTTVSTQIRFDSPILTVEPPPWQYFKLNATTDTIDLRPQTLLDDGRGVWGSFQVETRLYRVQVVVHATEDPRLAHGLIEVVRRSQVEQEEANAKQEAQIAAYSQQIEQQAGLLDYTRARLASLETSGKHAGKQVRALQRQLAVLTKELDKVLKDRDALQTQLDISMRESKETEQLAEDRVRELKRKLAATERQRRQESLRYFMDEVRPGLKPVARFNACEHEPREQACVGLVRGRPTGEDLKVHWRITNREALPLHVIAIHQSQPVRRAVNDVLVDVPPNKKGAIFTVVPGAAVEGAVLVPDITKEDLRSFALVFVTDSGRQLAATGIDFYPMTEREMKDRDLDEEAKGRVSIHAVGLAGAVWLANPLNKEELDATTLWGVGARAGYGFNRYLSVEGELVYGWSEDASFDQGLTRSAKLGRASTGFKLSLGHKIIPTLRAGLGVQGMSHDVQMEIGQAPDIGFEVDGAWYISGGVDLRLGPVTLGLATSFDRLVSGVARSLELNVHIGWSWKS